MKLTKEQRRKRRKKLGINKHKQKWTLDKCRRKDKWFYTHEATLRNMMEQANIFKEN